MKQFTKSHGDLKDFEIRVSTTSLDAAAFTTVLTGTAQHSTTLQPFKFPQAVPDRYVELYARDNYESPDAVEVDELEVVSTTPPKPTAGTPTPTATPTPTTSPTAPAQTRPTATSTSTGYKGYQVLKIILVAPSSGEAGYYFAECDRCACL